MSSVKQRSSEIVERWLPISSTARNDADVCLICFPHAGGMHSAFSWWHSFIPQECEVRAVAMPGRGLRFRENPAVHVDSVVNAVMEAIHASRWRHVAIFGDCSGSIVALALAQAMQNKGIPRLHHLFAAGIPNPITVDPNPRHKWSDGQFAAWAVDYGLLPRELLDDDRAREYFLRQIRNDFALIEQYKAKADPLECKITTFVGSSDALASESFAVWSSLTTKQWQHDTLDCGHLVNTEGSRQLQSAIFANLTDIVQTV